MIPEVNGKSPYDVFAGPIRSNDPRRYFMEAMIGAVRADGVASREELAELQRHIGNHALLSGLAPQTVNTMLQMASESIDFAGGSLARVPAIARGLSFRVHRMVAFALACEICTIDSIVVDAERRFIEDLRVALRVSALETEAITFAIERGRTAQFLLDRIARIQSLMPVACELFSIRALTKMQMHDDQRFAIRDYFRSIIDLSSAEEEIDGHLYQCFRKPRNSTNPVPDQLTAVAQLLPDPVDRYWMTVYALAAEPVAQQANWRTNPFTGLLQNAFQLAEQDMLFATQDAQTFPAQLPRLV
jgi:hypothetical protein